MEEAGAGAGDALSSRGRHLAGTAIRVDYDAFLEAEEDAYDAVLNPSGKIALNIAENRLSWSDLRERLEAAASGTVPAWVPGYTSALGAPEFREAAARFLSEQLTGCPIDPEHLAASAGATAVIEASSILLADTGDVAVIPAPCYPVYRQDIGNVAGVERFDLVTHQEPSEIVEGPLLDVHHLEGALEEIEADRKSFRMLILTSPDNPTGGIYALDRLEEIADWCIARQIHLVVNEIYGLSLLDTDHAEIRDDYTGAGSFTSFANVMEEKESDYLHLWYALSKDLGMSGFRVGFAYSRNQAFLQAYANLNLPRCVSNHTQWLLSEVLSDSTYMDRYVARNRERLTASYALVVGYLRRYEIPYVPSRGSLFVWIDLSELLDDDSREAELALWEGIFRSTGVLLTPGVGFGHAKNGLFRLVHACVSPDVLRTAMARLGPFMEERRAAIG